LSPPEPAQFAEPWEAQALAIANELVRVGRFTACEWANALGEAIRHGEQTVGPDDGSSYYTHVLSALEALAIRKSLVTQCMLDARKGAWAEAYEHTPHGKPVMLK
jgi:nitrile hydratase accessory protein